MVATAKPETYGLPDEFERILAALLCARPRLYGRVGIDLDPELFTNPTVGLIVKATKECARDFGHGPDSSLFVTERVKRWVNEGKVSHEQRKDVYALLDAADDYFTEKGYPDEESVVAALQPVVRRRLQRDAIQVAHREFINRTDFTEVRDMLDRASRFGLTDYLGGDIVGEQAIRDLGQLQLLSRLPSDVTEIDRASEGGLWRGALGLVIANTGGGKSMWLSHMAARAMILGFNVVYATLELPRPMVMARVLSNITGISINTLMQPQAAEPVFMERWRRIAPKGSCIIKDFTPTVTTPAEIKAWVNDREQILGSAVDLVCVDYVDRLGVPGKSSKETNHYHAMKLVTDELRNFAMDKKHWSWTASQGKGASTSKKRRATTDDAADSQWKVRIADMVVTANPNEDGDEIEWYIAKNRMGQAHTTTGPLPHEFSVGRIAMVPEPI